MFLICLVTNMYFVFVISNLKNEKKTSMATTAEHRIWNPNRPMDETLEGPTKHLWFLYKSEIQDGHHTIA